MKKIAVVTLPGQFNYGNRLQAYALSKAVKGIVSAEVEHVLPAVESNVLTRWSKLLVVSLLSRNITSFFVKLKKERAISPFSKEYLREVALRKQMKYDFALVGSDQVWHPGGIKERNVSRYFLTFVPPEKRIAYAPSFGLSSIPRNTESLYKEFLPQFKSVSVREDSGREIIEDLTAIKAPVVLDPTLLLTAKDWSLFTTDLDSKLKDKKYILRYTLGRLSDKGEAQIARLAGDNGYEIYQVLGDSMESGGAGDVPSVQEFLARIKNAQAVITDSFHASVFSTIFHTPFIAVRRPGADMSSRIVTLLEMTGMTQNLSADDANFTQIISESDFSGVDARIQRHKELSMDYLRSALEQDKSTGKTIE